MVTYYESFDSHEKELEWAMQGVTAQGEAAQRRHEQAMAREQECALPTFPVELHLPTVPLVEDEREVVA